MTETELLDVWWKSGGGGFNPPCSYTTEL